MSQSILEQYQLDPKNIPSHIAIIMDGNGRWAKKRFRPRTSGHKAGRKALKKTLESCAKLGVKYLSAYAFSTENWRRPESEVTFLMQFLKNVIQEELDDLKSKQVRLRFIGHLDKLNPDIIEQMKIAESETAHNSLIQLNIMVNYGSRDEIIHAVKSIVSQKINVDDIDDSCLSKALYTHDIPDPEILIRTSGEQRISNYLLWQLAYTELFFLDTLWPDFSEHDLIQVIQAYQSRHRRYGGL